MICCPSNKVIKTDKISFLALGGLPEDSLSDTLKAMVPTNVKTVHQTSLLHIQRATSVDSDCRHLPTASVLSNKADESRSN